MRSVPSLAAAAAAFAATAFLASAPPAGAQVLQAGTLTCSVAPGVGLVVGSRKDVTCTFQTPYAQLEVYDGAITKVGLDIGITTGAVIIWNVLTSGPVGSGVLSGDYVGVTAEASAAAGLGANVLTGGFNRSVTLQPLSVSAQTGLNLAAGAAELTLRLRPQLPPPGPPPRR